MTMTVKIHNTLTDHDYIRLMETLTDELYGDPQCISSLQILPKTRLRPPLKSLGKEHGVKIDCRAQQTYFMQTNILYENNNGFIETVINTLRSSLPKKYRVKIHPTGLYVLNHRLDYNIFENSTPNAPFNIMILTGKDRVLSEQMLENDVPTFFDLTESVINTSYDLAGKKVDLDIKSRIITNKGKDLESNLIRLEENPFKLNLLKAGITFGDIGGCEKAKSELKLLSYGLKNPSKYTKWGLRYPKGILLYGPPGTGKTLLAKAMSSEACANFYSVEPQEIRSMWYGKSEKLMNEVFDKAQKNAPSILFFDEFDSIASRRNVSHEATSKSVSVLLQRMDGMKEMNGLTVIGATNFIENIDPAVLRPGRFDKLIKVTLPNEKARKEILKIHCRGKRVEGVIDYDLLSRETEKLSGADIESIIQRGLENKLREEILGKPNVCPLSTEDIVKTIKSYKSERVVLGDKSCFYTA